MENYYKVKWTAGWYIPIIIFLFLRGDGGFVQTISSVSPV